MVKAYCKTVGAGLLTGLLMLSAGCPTISATEPVEEDSDKSLKAADILQGLRPMYLTSGFPVDGTAIDKHSADVKFQLSFAVSLWRNMGNIDGLNLKVGYSQRSVWMLYDKSSPFKDNMFIPGLYLDIPIHYRNSLSKADIFCGIEHRSNGRDDKYSRSVNYIFGEYTHSFQFGLTLSANLRAGFGWYDDTLTQAIFYRFQGYATLGALYELGRFSAMVSLTPCFAPFSLSKTAELSFRLAKEKTCPFHLFVQYHHGYDECMCDCVNGFNPPHYLRFGILISPRGSGRLRM